MLLTSELPMVNEQWAADRSIALEMFSDPTLSLCEDLVGSFDVSAYFCSKHGANIGPKRVCMPGVVVITGTGLILSKYIASTPASVHLKPMDIMKMAKAERPDRT